MGWQAWPRTVFNGRKSRAGREECSAAVTVARIAGLGGDEGVVAAHATNCLEGDKTFVGFNA